jgi:uncharacterized NAD(P)/FAD-binding protein YdhS
MGYLTLPDRAQHVAIIGGGASGTLAAAALLRHSVAVGVPLTVTLIDQHGRHGLGVAYSTANDSHLLNAVAGQMSALPGDDEHLITWANGAGRCHLPIAAPDVTAATFLPRPVYGRYLVDTLSEAERRAAPRGRLTRITAETVAIRRNPVDRRLRVLLAGRDAIDADVAIIATGFPAGQLPLDAPATARVIGDPWLPGALDRVLDATGPISVVIVGTGPTMLDLAVTLTAANPEAVVHAVSRHGLLPRTHPGTAPKPWQPVWLPVISRTTAPVRLTDLMWQVRAAMEASPASWHEVMCALRPLVPGLWRHMPLQDRRLFLRHLARYWEVHRHLVPPATATRITALRCTGRLAIHRGRVLHATPADGRLQTLLDTGQHIAALPADWLVNAAGPASDVTQATSPLLHDMFATGIARPDPLRLGIDAAVSGAVLDATGAPSDVLFTLGPPLRGLWYETTAIPEIRDQAAALARLLTSTAGAGQNTRPDSAA